MRNIGLESLRIPANSQQKPATEECIEQIALNILAEGLHYPPVVKQLPDGRYTLIVGERRVRAVCFLAERQLSFSCFGETIPPGLIPAIALSDILLGSADVSTFDRSSSAATLNWSQQTAAIAELHSFRFREAINAGRHHTEKATAAEIMGEGNAPGAAEAKHVNQAIILSRHLTSREIAAAHSQDEAYETLRRIALAKSIKSKATDD